MCMGRTHVIAGGAAGLATGTAFHLTGVPLAEWTAITAAAATLPDIDQVGSCASRSLGFASTLVAHAARRLSGGHRHFTHTLPGAAVFAGLAWLGGHYRHDPAGRWGLALLLAIAFTGAARALAIPGHLDDLTALAAAVAMAVTGWGLALAPAAIGAGALAHIAADACTDEGVPLAWPLWRGHVRFLPEPLAFTTGSRPEAVFAGAMIAALAGLAWLALHAATVPALPR